MHVEIWPQKAFGTHFVNIACVLFTSSKSDDMRTFDEVQLSESKMKGLEPTDWLRSCLNFILIVVYFLLYVPFGFFCPGKFVVKFFIIQFCFFRKFQFRTLISKEDWIELPIVLEPRAIIGYYGSCLEPKIWSHGCHIGRTQFIIDRRDVNHKSKVCCINTSKKL